jgi:hypothetical protein
MPLNTVYIIICFNILLTLQGCDETNDVGTYKWTDNLVDRWVYWVDQTDLDR